MLDANQFNLTLSLECTDTTAASQAVGLLDGAWKQARTMMVFMDLAQILPKTKQVLTELTNTLQFSAQGNSAQVSVSILKQSINDVLQELSNLGALGGGGGGMPGGGMPGGMGPGGDMPGGGIPGGGKGGGGKGGGRKKGGGR
jgi:hypothetical protein